MSDSAQQAANGGGPTDSAQTARVARVTPAIDATLFPILEQGVFFNHAAVAPLSGPAAAAIRAYADHAQRHAYVDTDAYPRIEALRRGLAELIHARGPHEIAMMPNTSTGLATVAEGIDWRPGDHVVITDVEYPANRYPWENLKRLGVTMTEVRQGEDLRIDVEEVCDAVTDRTRVVAISHVQFASGHRIELGPISEMVHRVGGYLCVDAIQSVGLLPVDVRTMGIDFLAADGHKWMLGPEGAGFLYVHEDLIRLLHPPVVGWLNMKDAHDYSRYRFEFEDTAQRFEPGSWNVPGLVGLGASVELLLSVGIDEVWRRTEALTSRLDAGLREAGYRVRSPRRLAGERSGSVVFEGGEGFDAARVAATLRERDVTVAVRNGRLRATPHFYNTAEQVDRMLAALPR